MAAAGFLSRRITVTKCVECVVKSNTSFFNFQFNLSFSFTINGGDFHDYDATSVKFQNPQYTVIFCRNGNALFNDTLNTFYFRLYCVGHR